MKLFIKWSHRLTAFTVQVVDSGAISRKGDFMGIAKEVCRIEKLKSVGALGGAYEHNLRLRDILNADETKTTYNIELTDRPSGKSYVDCFHDKMEHSPWYQNENHKIAKNAIYGVEFMLTFGNEATDKIDIKKWCTDNIKWLESHFGGSENVVSAILHLDERTPHIHAVVIPLDEKGKLNYTKYLGGSKYRLSELQDSYHSEVGIYHQLDRGMKGSKATHQDIDNFYSMVNEAVAVTELPEPEQKTGLFKKSESALEYQQRISPEIQHLYSVAISKEKENELLKKRIADIEHLQEGVVPADLHNEAIQKINQLETRLERSERNEKYYDLLKKRFKELQAKSEQKTTDYETLEEKYEFLSKKYLSLKSAASQAENLQWENKLMYTLLKTLNKSESIDKCRSAHANGKVSIEERLIYGTEKSQRENMQRTTNSTRQSSVHKQWTER